MVGGFEIFQNVLNYKQQNDLAIGGRSGLFECRSGSRDFCAPGIVWIMLMLLPVILPVIVGGGGLALLIYFLSSASGDIDENEGKNLDGLVYNFVASLAPMLEKSLDGLVFNFAAYLAPLLGWVSK